MRGTKELAWLCWLGPAELGNFIKRQMNVRKGSGALGEVAPSSWLGLCCAWSLHPSQPSSVAQSDPGSACPGVGAGPEELAPVMDQRKALSQGEPCPWSAGLALPLPACSCPSPPAPPHPTDTRDPPLNPPEHSSSTPLWIYCTSLLSLLFKPFPPLKSGDFSAAPDIHFNGQSFQKVTTETLDGS